MEFTRSLGRQCLPETKATFSLSTVSTSTARTGSTLPEAKKERDSERERAKDREIEKQKGRPLLIPWWEKLHNYNSKKLHSATDKEIVLKSK